MTDARPCLSLLVFQVVVLPLPASPVAFASEAALGMTPGAFVFLYLRGPLPGQGPYTALCVLNALAVSGYLYRWRGLRVPRAR